MRRLAALAGLVLFAALMILSIPEASAANFTATESPGSVAGNANQLFNFTINNTDTADNVIQVNITLPSGFVFVGDSNQTSASNNIFYNTSTVLVWDNTTAGGFIDTNGTTKYFEFNATTPNSSGNYSITLDILDTNQSSNSTSFNITVDGDDPGIVLNYPGNNTVHGSSAMTFNFTATDVIDDNMTCNLTIDGSVNQTGFGAENGNVTSRTVSGLNPGEHSWSVTCWDDYSHTTITNTSFFGIYSDLIVTYINWTSSPDNHTAPGSNVTIKATIKNNGTFDISESINISLWWGDSFVENQGNTSELEAGTSQIITFSNVSSTSLVTNGIHTITVFADSGNDANETNESNNNLTMELLVGFNVTVDSLSNATLYANESLNISVHVLYANGDPVSNLEEANFTTIYDDVGGGSVERNWGLSSYQGTSVENFTNSSNGLYWFNIYSYYNPTSPGPGVHNITVGAVGGNYSGSSSGLDSYYLMVPSFTITFGSLMTAINEELTDAFNIYVTNSGTAILEEAHATISDSHTSLTFTTCSSFTNVTNDTNQYSVCAPTMTALAVTSDDNGCFSASVGGKSNGLYFNTTSSLQCVDVLDTSTGTGPSGSSPTGSTCSSDADCSTGYYCSTSGTCVRKAYSVSITSYTSSIDVNWSSYQTTKVTVKNEGTNTFTAKLMVSVSGLDMEVMPSSMTLNPGNAIMFTINVSAPETATVGEHTGTIKAYVNEDTSIYQTKAFAVNVLTTDKKKQEINDSYNNYTAVYDDLKARLDRLRSLGFVNQSDIDEVWGLLNDTLSDLGLAKTAIVGGDYSTADGILAVMNTSINSIDSKLDDLESEQGQTMTLDLSGSWLWIVIAVVVIIVAVFIVYLFLPSIKGQKYGAYGYKPVIKEGIGEKLSKMFSRRKKKSRFMSKPEKPSKQDFRPTGYKEGYEKLKSSYKSSRGGKFEGIKKKLKRKKPQKSVTDYFG